MEVALRASRSTPVATASDAQLPQEDLALEVVRMSHAYDGTCALDQVSLAARRGAFVTLLGESGSGKTTFLRLVAGLDKPQSVERLCIGGVDVRNLPAFARNSTTVFQHYALFPHMSVGENVAYGLRVRGIAHAIRRSRALEMLRLVRLGDKYNRRVHQLSGGERQRVALARALVTEPEVLLLDEPLAALDQKLRADMQVELKQLHSQLGITFIYVTHSQDEALSMSDRIVLMRRGRIMQEGPPQALLDRPLSRFVAEFMGVENLLGATFVGTQGDFAIADVQHHKLCGRWCGGRMPAVGDAVCVALRAERLQVDAQSAGSGPQAYNEFPCRLSVARERGRFQDLIVDGVLGTLVARTWRSDERPEAPRFVGWRADDCAITAMDNFDDSAARAQ
jgi:ABC-type Fe3+/spermidine/putrescine transport system ATPase subunit